MKVPEGMLKAATGKVLARLRAVAPHLLGEYEIVAAEIAEASSEAALLWQRDNPLVPTPMEADEIREAIGNPEDIMQWQVQAVAEQWVERMYDASKREAPEEIKDLMWTERGRKNDHNAQVVEAYRRGQKSK